VQSTRIDEAAISPNICPLIHHLAQRRLKASGPDKLKPVRAGDDDTYPAANRLFGEVFSRTPSTMC
jgi:hypothetical protein